MADESDLLLQLLIQGLKPGAAEAIANDAGNKFGTALNAVNAKLLALHETQSRLLLASDINRVQKQIDEERKKGKIIEGLINDQVKSYERAQKAAERAAGEGDRHFRSTLALMRDIKIVGMGAVDTLSNLWSSFKHVGEEVIRTSQVYGSLKGSIESLRTATNGEVANMDLILARNRATQKELELTDREWAAVGARAKQYADALGTNVKDALDQVIDGLATGRMKTLQSAGVMVDATAANIEYAASLGKTVDKLTEEEKKHAITEAALRKMTAAYQEGGDVHETVASRMEQSLALAKNAWDEFMLALGQSDALKAAIGLMRDALVVANGLAQQGVWDLFGQGRRMELAQASEFDAMTKAALAAARSANRGGGASTTPDVTFDETEKIYGGTGKKKRRGGAGSGPSSIEVIDYQDMLAKMRADFNKKNADMMESAAGDYGGGSSLLGMIALGDEAEAEKIESEMQRTLAMIAGNVLKKEKLAALTARVSTGAGLLEELLFGPAGAGPAGDAMIAAAVSIGDGVAAALGEKFAAAVFGGQEFSLKKAIAQIARAKTAEMMMEAIVSGAKAVGLAFFNPPAAAQQAYAAAGYAAAAVAIGAVGSRFGAGVESPVSARTGGGGSAPVQRGGGGQTDFGGASSRATGGSSESGKVIQPQFFVWPGGEARAGEEFVKFVEAYQRQSGRRLLQGNV